MGAVRHEGGSATSKGDFEKGAVSGAVPSLKVVEIARGWLARGESE